ncbi:diguanylate cyclase [Pseudoflavonifractor sp. MSJ-37]|uniref:GGDEF domain-containing protein n=1 Tax=Pseudoflavonifractor sp. MSJ-37 TaxID=2841531 RepID=UPI001C0F5C65|nr:diguanylate cyclase [Pseudoflavonifractor sp. MSJ-37]MBU5435529.1 diguanylate cyclase [Pseudoflavonifractor sp. MSJ-37]
MRQRGTSVARYGFGLLVCLEVLMSFTFLGYIHIPPISITTAYLPILAAGCLLGTAQAAAMGLLFGLASLFKASASYVMPADGIFSPFHSGAPVPSLILSVGTRVLFGLLVGLAFRAARGRRHERLWVGLIGGAATHVHAFLVYLAMGAFFPEYGYDYARAFHLGAGELALDVACVVLTELLLTVRDSGRAARLQRYIDQTETVIPMERKIVWWFAVFEGTGLLISAAAALYFAQRRSYMLNQHGVTVTREIGGDLLHLQIQFMLAALALNFIALLLLLAMYRYMAYREYLGELDSLTGVMGRRMFLRRCDQLLADGLDGWYLSIDVDLFKSINDTFGHPAGDRVLAGIGEALRTAFATDGAVGRVGGDEFAVIVTRPLTRAELARRLDGFLADIAGLLPEWKVTCSIGARCSDFQQDITELLTETDDALYRAKARGRACYVIDGGQ